MNKIYRNLITIFIVMTALMFSFLSIEMVQSDVNAEMRYLQDIAVQVKKNVGIAETNYERKLSLMEGVWAERIKSAEAIIAKEPQMKELTELRQMRTIMGASDIHLLKEDGTILISTDESMVGTMLSDEQEKLARLMEGSLHGGYYMHVEDSGFWVDPSYCRLFMRSTSDEYAAICVVGDVNQMALKCQRTLIDTTLQEAATEFGTSIVAVGKDSGVVLGMTANNKQVLEIKGHESKEETKEFLQKVSEKGKGRATINGEMQVLAVVEIDGAYVAAFSSVSEILRNMLIQWAKTFFLFLVMIVVVILALQYTFDKYLMRQLQEMEEKLAEILEGNFNVTITEGNNKDINKLIRVIDRLKMGYIHKSERSDKIFQVLGDNIAVFECVFEADYYYFSDKIKNMLSMSEDEWNRAYHDRRGLIELLQGLEAAKDENNIICYQGRYLEVQVLPVGKELIGVLVDHTDEFTRRISLESELEKSKEKMVKDDLTQVLNRGGFEEWTRRFLMESETGGVMIAFDLDNFKGVNDSLGHPEGDKVLRIFAGCLKEMFRSEDVIGRLGGDEFFVFMTKPIPEENLDLKMKYILEKMNDSFGYYHTKFGVSVSAGVVFAKCGDRYEALYKKADQALYEAKKAGKGRYALYR